MPYTKSLQPFTLSVKLYLVLGAQAEVGRLVHVRYDGVAAAELRPRACNLAAHLVNGSMAQGPIFFHLRILVFGPGGWV